MRIGLGLALNRPGSGGLPVPGVSFDFVNDEAVINGASTSSTSPLTLTRASTKYVQSSNGLWSSVASGVAGRSDLGLLVEEARTNVVLWCRDLTNAAWTKTTCTAAKDQTGIDGGANTASSLTASAGNATCLQAITLASSARFQTAFVKRLTGSGVVQMTMDNGTTWTTVTVTGAWTRVSIPTQTLANPTVGFRIVTSGDAVAVDFVSNENGAFATSPILTTTAAAARANDVVSYAYSGSLAIASALITWRDAMGGILARRVFDRQSSGFFGVDAYEPSVTGARTFIIGGQTAAKAYTPTTDAVHKVAAYFQAGDTGISLDGTTVVSGTSGSVAPAADTGFLIGFASGATKYLNGYVQSFKLWPGARLPNASLVGLSS